MSNSRLFVIGANGFLGGYVARAASGSYEVIRGFRGTNGQAGAVEIDVTDANSIEHAFELAKPDAVILLAALSDIDHCEAEPKLAHEINVRGAEYVANTAAQRGARLVFTSSSAVFDGQKHGYSEDDAPNPVNVYGKTKALAESLIRALVPSAIVIRVSLVLGLAERPMTNSLLNNLTSKWKTGESVALPTFEYRNPIDACSLSRVILRLLASADCRGIYHLGSQDSISRYELGSQLARRTGFPGRVRPQTEVPKGRAPRGMDHFLVTDRIQRTFGMEMPTCEQVIERCFS